MLKALALGLFAFIIGGMLSIAPLSAEDRSSVDPALCRMLVKHVPDADVAYQPGVDVNGNAVAPADVPSTNKIKMPDKIAIPITVGLASTLNLNTNAYPYNQLGAGTEAIIGTVTLEGDRVYFNGSPLSDDQEDNLSVLCMQPSE